MNQRKLLEKLKNKIARKIPLLPLKLRNKRIKMIVCCNCGYSNPHAFKGFKSEEKFIRVIDGTKCDSEKRFLCGIECYVEETIKREYLDEEDDNYSAAQYKEYFEKRYPEVKTYLSAFPAIQDFFKRNGLKAPEPEKEFDVNEEIKDWADC